MRSLDIGCGPNPKGKVNLDLFQGDTPHHIRKIDGRAYMNFVQGDAQHLPFKDKAFKRILVSHCFEHMLDPNKGLREFCRVSDEAIIRVPNNPVTWEHPQHLYSWSYTSFRNLLLKYYDRVQVTAYTRPGYPGKSRAFRFTKKVPIIGRWLARMALAMMKLELEAYCMYPKDSEISYTPPPCPVVGCRYRTVNALICEGDGFEACPQLLRLINAEPLEVW